MPQPHGIAVVVANDLYFDVARMLEEFLHISEGEPKALRASSRVSAIASCNCSALATTRMPRPPPPPAALTMTGYPISNAMRSTEAGSSGSAVSGPGTQGTPAAIIARFAAILSPMIAIDEAGGPMKISPAFSTASANAAFSDRKP